VGAWIDRFFMLRSLLGDGEVIGRSRIGASGTLSVVVWRPKGAEVKLLNGRMLMGESGDDDGDGSDSGEESVVDMVVVGDESADSDICVEVLSWCLCVGSVGGPVGCSWWCSEGFARECSLGDSTPTSLGSTTVTVSRSAIVSASRSNTDMKEGI
jgi:hypothetical protein